MTTRHETHSTVCEVIAEVIADGGRPPNTIEDSQTLRQDLALDSLDLAVIVVRLEQKLDADPFRRRRRQVRTVGDLVDAYFEELSPAS